jgi:phosphotransacetylase
MAEFNGIIEKAKQLGKPMRVAVAGADAENILLGVFEAQEEGFVDPILIGNFKKIQETLEKLGLNGRQYDLQPVANDTSAVQYAIEMVNAGNADALMRGNTQTRDFLLPVLNKANHLVEDKALLTHVVVLKVPEYSKLLAVSDVTLLIEPSQQERKKVVANMAKALKIFGIEKPNIALLSMVDKPSFHIRESVEAQTIVKEHKDNPIADCNLVGPIAYDLIVSEEAARLKEYDCEY